MSSHESSVDVRPTSPRWFTVRVEHYMHVVLEVPFDGHPDFADTEAVAVELSRHMEAGEPANTFRDADVTYATISAEAEPW